VIQILDTFCRLRLKANYVSKAGYAYVFRWNKETGEYIKFGPTEIISVQGYRLGIGTRDIIQPTLDGSAPFAFHPKK
jgi:hypothetical protein